MTLTDFFKMQLMRTTKLWRRLVPYLSQNAFHLLGTSLYNFKDLLHV